MIELLNPRRSATIENWPIGRNQRGVAEFSIESNKKGERVLRQIGTAKAKATTYYKKMCIMDGADGRTYLLGETDSGYMVMMNGTLQGQQVYWPKDEEFKYLMGLLKEAR